MKDKLTTGEIAKKAGISQKAIRLYDEKGLLKGYSYFNDSYPGVRVQHRQKLKQMLRREKWSKNENISM